MPVSRYHSRVVRHQPYGLAKSLLQHGSNYATKRLKQEFKKHMNRKKSTHHKSSMHTITPVSTIKRESGTGPTAAAVKRRKNKSVSIKGKKRVKVTKGFKNKVEQVLLSKQPSGVYRKVYGVGSLQVPTTNQQFITQLGNYASGEHFTPNKYLDAVSCLWNGKTAIEYPVAGDLGNLPQENMIINVASSSAVYRFRNNSNRTIMFDLVEAKPRNQKVLLSPREQWITCLNTDIETGVYQGVFDDINNLYNKASFTKTYNTYYAETTTKIVMEPGQTYCHTIQGPSNQSVHMNQFWQAVGTSATPTYSVYNTLGRYVYARVHSDMVSDSVTNFTNRYQTYLPGEGVLYEIQEYFKVECPRMVELTNCHDSYLTKQFYPSTIADPLRHDEQNPAIREIVL